MTHFVLFLVFLGLVILQTTVIPDLSFSPFLYDLVVPFVLFLGLYRSVRESLPGILFMGLVLDSLTGGPFGIYLTTYFWCLVGCLLIRDFLHVGNVFLLPLILGIAVFFENLVFWGAVALSDEVTASAGFQVLHLEIQVLLAIITGPLWLKAYGNLFNRLEKWVLARHTRKKGIVEWTS